VRGDFADSKFDASVLDSAVLEFEVIVPEKILVFEFDPSNLKDVTKHGVTASCTQEDRGNNKFHYEVRLDKVLGEVDRNGWLKPRLSAFDKQGVLDHKAPSFARDQGVVCTFSKPPYRLLCIFPWAKRQGSSRSASI
jgi:hypothetical protein